MSQESAKKFIEKCQNDPNFKKTLSQAKDQKEATKILQEHGFSFTKTELKTAAKNAMGKSVTDEDLTKIAGGSAYTLFQLPD